MEFLCSVIELNFSELLKYSKKFLGLLSFIRVHDVYYKKIIFMLKAF